MTKKQKADTLKRLQNLNAFMAKMAEAPKAPRKSRSAPRKATSAPRKTSSRPRATRRAGSAPVRVVPQFGPMVSPQGWVQPVQAPSLPPRTHPQMVSVAPPPPPPPMVPMAPMLRMPPPPPPLPGMKAQVKKQQAQDALAKRVAALIRAQKGLPPAPPALKAPPALPQGFFKKAVASPVKFKAQKVQGKSLQELLAEKALARKPAAEAKRDFAKQMAELNAAFFNAPKGQTAGDKKLRESQLELAIRKLKAEQKAQKERAARPRSVTELIRQRGEKAEQARHSGLAQLRQAKASRQKSQAAKADILRRVQQVQGMTDVLERSKAASALKMQAKQAGVILPAGFPRKAKVQQGYEPVPLMAQQQGWASFPTAPKVQVPRGVSGQSIQTAAQRIARLKAQGLF